VNPSALLADTLQTLTDRARRSLNPNRFLHLLGVTHTVTALAGRHGLDPGQAALAGLLHDLSKQIDPNAIKKDLAGWGIAIPPEDRDHPHTWHGLHAAEWARRKLDLNDPDILEAVTLHTTADAGVCPLTQALFVADFTEPLRGFKQAPPVLDLARRDLLEGFREALRVKVTRLRNKGRSIHPRARRALLDFCPEEGSETISAVG
jgi:predicted HD superfamily hydrolase involved in NAD metabolism